MGQTCEWWVVAFVGCVHICLSFYVFFLVLSGDMECTGVLVRDAAIIYNTLGLAMWCLALFQAKDSENENPRTIISGFLAQAIVMGLYGFVSTIICPSSDSALCVWTTLGMIQALYLVCALMRLSWLFKDC